MNSIQQVYSQAKDCDDRLETEALRQLRQILTDGYSRALFGGMHEPSRE
jgi:hypothetical protein